MCYNDETFDDYIAHCGQETEEGYTMMLTFEMIPRSSIPDDMSFDEWMKRRPKPSVWSSWWYIVQLPLFFWTKWVDEAYDKWK